MTKARLLLTAGVLVLVLARRRVRFVDFHVGDTRLALPDVLAPERELRALVDALVEEDL
jgi:hypothetical protein